MLGKGACNRLPKKKYKTCRGDRQVRQAENSTGEMSHPDDDDHS